MNRDGATGRRLGRLAAATCLALWGWTAAQAPEAPPAPDVPEVESEDVDRPDATLSVAIEPEGGPLTLEEDLLEAAAAWREAGAEELRVEVNDDADDRFTYGDPDLLGPDAVSITVRDSEAAGVEVRLHPQLVARFPATLPHEIGRLAGLPLTEEGVLSPALSTEGPTAPTEADIARWRARADFVPEDLNRDGVVDLYDLAQLAEAYGNRGVQLEEDLDGSGEVDAGDLERLREAYRFLAPSEEAPGEQVNEAETDAPTDDAPTDHAPTDDAEPGEVGDDDGASDEDDGASDENVPGDTDPSGRSSEDPAGEDADEPAP